MKERTSRLLIFIGFTVFITVVYLILMWWVVFPWLDRFLPINDVQVSP